LRKCIDKVEIVIILQIERPQFMNHRLEKR